MLALPWRALSSEGFSVRNTQIRLREGLENADCKNDNCGAIAYDAAVVLAHFAEKYAAKFRFDRCVELGCGTGAVSIALAILGAKKIFATDLPHVLHLTRQNIELNGVENVVKTQQFDWTKLLEESNDVLYQFDATLIVASDPLYSPALVAPFVGALKITMQNNLNATALVCLKIRSNPLLKQFYETVAANELKLEEAQRDEEFVIVEITRGGGD